MLAFHAALTVRRRITGFRVRLRRGTTARCPELILEPVLAIGAERRQPANTDTTAAIKEPSSAGVGEPAARRAEAADGPRELAVRDNSPWVAGFMEDVQRRLCDRPPDELTNADRAAILFTWESRRATCGGWIPGLGSDVQHCRLRCVAPPRHSG